MARKKIALIGGGQIGGNLALLANQKELGDVVIYDIPQAEGMTKGKALDLMQLRPHDGYDGNLEGTSNPADLIDSDVVIITAGIPRKPGMDREDLLEINIKIITDVANNVKKYAPNAFVIVVSNPLDAIVYSFYKVSGFPKNKIIGMAGALDSGRFRTFLAMETGYSVQDISCMVLGGHGDTMVPITRLATIGGIPAEELIPKDRLDAIVNRVRYAGGEIVKLFGNGSAYYAPAASAIEMAESYLMDKKRIIPSAALCEGEFGVDGYFIGVPTVIGSGGIEKILEFNLLPHEQEMLNDTLDAVKKTDYEGTTKEVVYLDELAGISATQLETLSKNEIHTGEDFLDSDKNLLLDLKGFGEKTIKKISTIIEETISSLEIKSPETSLEEVEVEE